MWSRKFAQCVSCGTAQRSHIAKGLCEYCYMRQYAVNHASTVKKQKHDWYYARHAEQLAAKKITREQRHFDGKRTAALIAANGKCAHCGATHSLCVHHKNGQGRGSTIPDNDDANLEVLCRRCHIAVHRFTLVSSRRRDTTPKLNVHGRWSVKHAACLECHTTYSKHAAHGLCGRCYQRIMTR